MKPLIRPLIVATCAMVAAGSVAVPGVAAPKPGRLDHSFSSDGKRTTFNRGSTGYAVAIDGRRRIVVAGYTLTRNTDIAVARFLPNGKPDRSFGRAGRVITDLGGTDYAFDVAIHPRGGIVVAGERDTRKGSRAVLVRYRSGGALDRRFGGGDGVAMVRFGKRYQGANAVVVSAKGAITIGGFTSNGSTARWALARFRPGGTLDRRFGKGGKVTVNLAPADEQINDLVVAEGGRIVAAGYAASGITPRFAVARFRLNGKLDKGFGRKRGVTLVNLSKGSDIAFGLAQGPKGQLLAAGLAGNGGRDDWGLLALGPKGRRNGSFGKDGVRLLRTGKRYEFAYGAAVQPNGRSVVVGRAARKGHGAEFGVFRLKRNGGYDKGFSGNGRAFVDFFGGNDTARDVAIQSNGKIIVVGEATRRGVRRMAVARLIGQR